jgi:hypothetical protein
LRFLIRLKQESPRPGDFLATVTGIAKAFGVDARNPKWTSYGALELDIFTPARADFELFASAIKPLARFEFITDLNVAPPHKEEGELFDDARRLFNAERYWESHEVLEGVWRTRGGDEKRLLQGMILVCAAFVHHQKGEDEAAVGILKRSAAQLEYGGPKFAGFDLEKLRRHVQGIIETGRFTNFRI